MYKEIDLGNNNTLVLFCDEDFWSRLIPNYFEDSNTIDIVTYNFNFIHKNERSFYNKLIELSQKGVGIRLLYAKSTFSKLNDIEIEDIFKQSIICANLENNHAKIFVSDTVAFIGSANFSIGSNTNYECGIIIRDEDTINKISEEFVTELFKRSELINIPYLIMNDPMRTVLLLEYTIDKINNIIYEGEDLRKSKNIDLIFKLRFYDDIKDVLEKIGICFNSLFDLYLILRMLSQEEDLVDVQYNFIKDEIKNYICELKVVIKKVKDYLTMSYKEKGRIDTLKELKRYFEYD